MQKMYIHFIGILEKNKYIIIPKLHKPHLLVYDLLSIISEAKCHLIPVNVE